uniref:Uncharacterized protein n=1 Tax=Mus musculus TaxID=10090 RepID=Q8BIT1_MOUSE|nr:unnamed protein product [Mus musculus]
MVSCIELSQAAGTGNLSPQGHTISHGRTRNWMLAFLDPLSRFVNIKRSSPKVNELYLTLASRWISSMTPDLMFSSYPRNIGMAEQTPREKLTGFAQLTK